MPRPERPVDRDGGVVQRFAVELRELRYNAGSPGYRELARKAHYSATTLAQAARGDKLPSLPVTLAYVRACGGDPVHWTARWQAAAAELDPGFDTHDREPDDHRPPYVGLVEFGPDDSDRFFGRERLISRLADRLTDHRFVAVVGPSGSGKSSLLQAGLIPTLIAKNPTWSVAVLTPGSNPMEEWSSRLAAGRDNGKFLLVVDQFEEVFTLCAPDERARFIDAVLAAAHDHIHVVVGLRADFYGHCAGYPELVAAMENAQVVVGPMTTDELRQAITQPAVRAGCTIETALVARLVADATDQSGVLPLVSHALLQTWRRRRGNTGAALIPSE